SSVTSHGEGPVESWRICAYEADKSLRTVRSARLRYYYFMVYHSPIRDSVVACLLRGGADNNIKQPSDKFC
ncbi:hypothetical protein L195_g037726, partial [Trifolium pratense]